MTRYAYADGGPLEDAYEIDAEDIAENKDVAELTSWHSSLSGMADDVRAQIEANEIGKTRDAAWLKSATASLGFFMMGLKRCERRLKQLGVDVTLPQSERNQLLTALDRSREGLNKLRYRIHVADRFSRIVRTEVGDETYQRLLAAVTASFEAENRAEVEAESET